MTATVKFADVAIGYELPSQTFPIGRSDLVAYAAASGDGNPIHQDEAFAKSVGLPDVIAHGMFTMATAVRVVTDWCGDPGAVLEYGTRFTKPVVVPAVEGATLVVSGKIGALLDDGVVRVDLTAVSAGEKVLGVARALVRLA